VMMVAWAGMASGGYVGGMLFDLSLSYTLSFMVAGITGVLNLAVIGALAATRNAACAAIYPVLCTDHLQDLRHCSDDDTKLSGRTERQSAARRAISAETLIT